MQEDKEQRARSRNSSRCLSTHLQHKVDTKYTKKPAIIIAGTHSGCGKTTITLGIMAALCERGIKVQPFKCGPDFIDPTLHQMVTGRTSRNLDVRMCGSDFVNKIFADHAPEDGLTVIEGVMGLFDGGRGSAAYLAKFLDVPVILVIDISSAAESVAAVVKGFETLDPEIRLAGVIFNRVASERHQEMVTRAVEDHCQTKIIGCLPRDESISIPSRHLGLQMGMESGLDLKHLSMIITENIDLDALLEILGYANQQAKIKKSNQQPATENRNRDSNRNKRVKIGIAWDEAFCFYYIDNLDMIEAAGAELVLFSPLHDQQLPKGLDGIYLGGGYPELYAAKLSDNTGMREEIKKFSKTGKPVYGECGGFMYLTDSITDTHGNLYSMAGVYPAATRMRNRLSRLGYRRLEITTATLLGQPGAYLYGHEFHYSEVAEMDSGVKRAYLLDDGRLEGYLVDNTLAGYVHLHWGRTPEAAISFIHWILNP